jgi:hypothetical protein
MESRLVDLVFDELHADEKMRLLAEVETCEMCLSEYRSMTGTLFVFDTAAEASLPDESYWPGHQAALRQRLESIAPGLPARRRNPLWKRIFAARLPVPVPVAAVITLALLVSSVLALRPATGEVTTPSQTPVVTIMPPKVIEVPVFREQVITRTVYVEKKLKEKTEARRTSSPARRNETALTASNSENVSGQGGLFTRANLTDFQPPDELRIRIVKRNNDEN